MIRSLFLSFCMFILVSSRAQKLEFGLQFQQNANRIASNPLLGDFEPNNRFFDMLDYNGDTINVFMRSYTMSDNFEIPMYLRYQMKNRFFFELNYSNSYNQIDITGNTVYNNAYFVSKYGTKAEFDSAATAQGFTVDSTDYDNYILGYKLADVRTINAYEKFKLASFGFCFGMKLFPHKSIHPYFSAGFTYKTKYRTNRFESLDYDHPLVKNYVKVEEAIDRYRTHSWFLNFAGGLEFYRFRLEGFWQQGMIRSIDKGTTNEIIINPNPTRYTFNLLSVFGFRLSSTLFSKYFGRSVHYDELSDESLAVSNIRKKQLNYSLGFRFKRRLLQTLSSYYSDTNPLNVMSRDTAMLGIGGNLFLTERLQLISLEKVTRAEWSGQIEVFGDYHFSKRFFITSTLSFSALSVDFKSTQFQGVILYDSLGNASWLQTDLTPVLSPGVFRKQIGYIGIGTTLNWEMIRKDDFAVRMFAGFGQQIGISPFYAKDLPPGINDLPVYEEFDRRYNQAYATTPLWASTGLLNVQPSSDPNDVLPQLPALSMEGEWQSPRVHRPNFRYFHAGTEFVVDRYCLGISYERNVGYMDGFMLKSYNSLFLTIGYRLVSH